MFFKMFCIFKILILILIHTNTCYTINEYQDSQLPTFDKQVENITVKIGQQALLPCFVNNLGSNKVVWSKSGDILTFGTTKISSSSRINIEHRYVTEWHLLIENVVGDDEGSYICKTSGNNYKLINLQILTPPSMDDQLSTPGGMIVLKEGSSITLKCYAEGKPEPTVQWYRWKQYKNLVTEKEEFNGMGNEIYISSIKRNDDNMYECKAKNSVPPATSRIFNIEIQFLPNIKLNTKQLFQVLNKKVSLECLIVSNPLDNLYWTKNGVNLNEMDQYKNFRIDQFDVSSINSPYKKRFTLTIMNLKKYDFGEYQCCADNQFGSICSSAFVNEIKVENVQKLSMSTTTSDILLKLLQTSSSSSTTSTPSNIVNDYYSQDKQNDDLKANILYYDYDVQQNDNKNKPIVTTIKENSNNIIMLKSSDFLYAESSTSINFSISIYELINIKLIMISIIIRFYIV